MASVAPDVSQPGLPAHLSLSLSPLKGGEGTQVARPTSTGRPQGAGDERDRAAQRSGRRDRAGAPQGA